MSTASSPSGASVANAVVLPADVTWTEVAGVALPVSATAGPIGMVDGLAWGFAHSLPGAVIAGLHLLVRTTPQVGPDVFDPTIAGQVVSEDALLLRQSVTAQYTAEAARRGLPYGQPLGDLPGSVVGVRVESAEPDRVRLGVLTAAADRAGVTRFAVTSVTVVWVDGDWRLVAPAGGSWDAVVRLVDGSAVEAYTPVGRG